MSILKKSLIACYIFMSAPITIANFSDVAEIHPINKSLNYLKSNKIISGYSDGTFRLENKINRAEFTKIIVEAKYPNSATGSNCYSDVHEEWFAKYVCFAKSKNIIIGYEDETFKPNDNITFVEAAKIVAHAYNKNIIQSEPWYRSSIDYLFINDAIPSYVSNLGELEIFISRMDMIEMIYPIHYKMNDSIKKAEPVEIECAYTPGTLNKLITHENIKQWEEKYVNYLKYDNKEQIGYRGVCRNSNDNIMLMTIVPTNFGSSIRYFFFLNDQSEGKYINDIHGPCFIDSFSSKDFTYTCSEGMDSQTHTLLYKD